MNRIALLFSLSLAFNSFVFAQNFFDDFESYTAGEQLVVQNPNDWTTWSNSPGSAEDPFILELDSNVVEITGTNDLVYVMDNYTEGFYNISFDIYIPTGADGYFNTLQEFAGTSSHWGMQVYFGINNPGEGNIDGGGAYAASFTFTYDTWHMVEVTVDLDNDWGEFWLNGDLIHGWVWSSGTFGTGTLNQLGGSNFFAWDAGFYGNPLYYFDNYCVDFEYVFVPPAPFDLIWYPYYNDVKLEWEWSGMKDTRINGFQHVKVKEFYGFNVWHSFENSEWELEATGIMEYNYIVVDPVWGLHEYYVTAVVDGIESNPSNIIEIIYSEVAENNLDILLLYPNPALDMVNIRLPHNIESITVYNFSGQVISEETVDSKFYRMNTSSFSPGVYLFRIRTDEGVISKTVVIE